MLGLPTAVLDLADQKHNTHRSHRRAGRDPVAASAAYPIEGRAVEATTGEALVVRRVPDLEALERELRAVRESGISSLAVVLKHAAIFPDHERAVGELAKRLGFTQVSLSSSVSAMVKMVPRGYTATADAYLTPHILRHGVDGVFQRVTRSCDVGERESAAHALVCALFF